MQRRERESDHDRRAVPVRHDGARPAANAPLPVEEIEVVGIHLGDDERDVLLHPEGAGVAQHRAPGARERRLNVERDGGVERGEDDGRAHEGGIAGKHRQVERLRREIAEDGTRRLPVAPARGALGGGDLGEPEPGMPVQELDEGLPHGTGGAEHGDRDGLARSDHAASSARTRRL